ncbi:glycosyltransferase family 2 protein [Thermobifida halotolerans]|uniref:glycosyltransferase family 2 protein n=1 Tax=Thermobifida halotolerans TaxID=483545 RepID=UPI001F1E644B|nr:glycosyltransferase family 2 protein [Thermobifida halotolerans]
MFRNDWSVLDPPEVGAWAPGPTVSIVIPVRDDQTRLDLVLACLARQTYPEHLMEVVVVDDHSATPPRLPGLRPDRCRIEAAPPHGWGPGHARAHGARVTTGEVLCWLDADLLVEATLVEALVRWQHAHPRAVALGDVRYATVSALDPAEAAGLAAGRALRHRLTDAPPHPRVERLLARSDNLRDADSQGFRAFVGSCVTMSRTLYEAAGGVDPALALGHDTELGYRLWQAGGVFVPDRSARAWHLGSATVNRTRVPGTRSDALSDLVPYARSPHRPRRRAQCRVPLVRVVVDVDQHPYELVRACVDRLLACDGPDLEVVLAADWDTAGETWLEARLIQAHYLADPGVRFVPAAPRTGFPAPYLLRVPVTCGVGPQTVARMVERAEWAGAGVVELVHGHDARLTLWRTRALSRALGAHDAGEELVEAVAAVHGRYRMHGGAEVVDLSSRVGFPEGAGDCPRRRIPSALVRPWRRLTAAALRGLDVVRRRLRVR